MQSTYFCLLRSLRHLVYSASMLHEIDRQQLPSPYERIGRRIDFVRKLKREEKKPTPILAFHQSYPNVQCVVLRRRSLKFDPTNLTLSHSVHPLTRPTQTLYIMRLSSRLRRSAIDATRFTATSPHAYSKPSPLHSAPSSSSTSSTPRPQFQRLGVNPQSSPNRKGPLPPTSGAASSVMVETPAEKVARLRAARMAEKAAQFSRWDKAVVRGRGWADRAHKITVYFLVTFSGMSFPFPFPLII